MEEEAEEDEDVFCTSGIGGANWDNMDSMWEEEEEEEDLDYYLGDVEDLRGEDEEDEEEVLEEDEEEELDSVTQLAPPPAPQGASPAHNAKKVFPAAASTPACSWPTWSR